MLCSLTGCARPSICLGLSGIFGALIGAGLSMIADDIAETYG